MLKNANAFTNSKVFIKFDPHIIKFALFYQEREKAERINRKLRQQLADYRVPEVMEYVSEKADLYEVQKKVRSWERKVEIAEVSTGGDCEFCFSSGFMLQQFIFTTHFNNS